MNLPDVFRWLSLLPLSVFVCVSLYPLHRVVYVTEDLRVIDTKRRLPFWEPGDMKLVYEGVTAHAILRIEWGSVVRWSGLSLLLMIALLLAASYATDQRRDETHGTHPVGPHPQNQRPLHTPPERPF